MSNRQQQQQASGGTGFLGLLGLLFIGLKLGHVVGWSWLWVLSPLWIPVSLTVFVILCLVVLAVTEGLQDRRRW